MCRTMLLYYRGYWKEEEQATNKRRAYFEKEDGKLIKKHFKKLCKKKGLGELKNRNDCNKKGKLAKETILKLMELIYKYSYYNF